MSKRKKPKYKQVTKTEFDNFIKSYPYEIKEDYWVTVAPPWITYSDLRKGNNLEYNVVAHTLYYSDDPTDFMCYRPKDKRKYFIIDE